MTEERKEEGLVITRNKIYILVAIVGLFVSAIIPSVWFFASQDARITANEYKIDEGIRFYEKHMVNEEKQDAKIERLDKNFEVINQKMDTLIQDVQEIKQEIKEQN